MVQNVYDDEIDIPSYDVEALDALEFGDQSQSVQDAVISTKESSHQGSEIQESFNYISEKPLESRNFFNNDQNMLEIQNMINFDGNPSIEAFGTDGNDLYNSIYLSVVDSNASSSRFQNHDYTYHSQSFLSPHDSFVSYSETTDLSQTVDLNPESDHTIYGQEIAQDNQSFMNPHIPSNPFYYTQAGSILELSTGKEHYFYGQENAKPGSHSSLLNLNFVQPMPPQPNIHRYSYQDGLNYRASTIRNDASNAIFMPSTNEEGTAATKHQSLSLSLSDAYIFRTLSTFKTLPKGTDLGLQTQDQPSRYQNPKLSALISDGTINNSISNRVSIINRESIQNPFLLEDQDQNVKVYNPMPNRVSIIRNESMKDMLLLGNSDISMSQHHNGNVYNPPLDSPEKCRPQSLISLGKSPLPEEQLQHQYTGNAKLEPLSQEMNYTCKPKNRRRKCCYCFPADKFGVSLCVIITLIILLGLGLVVYFLYPRTPDFRPRLSKNVFGDGLIITKDPQNPTNFTASLSLLMNVTVYNPNPYELTVKMLELRASLQPNATALAGSGLPATENMSKDSVLPKTQLGYGTTNNLIFPARSESNFSFNVVIKLDSADFLQNPYLRPEIEQTCSVHIKNDFLEAFGYVPAITSSSSVRCPLSQDETAAIKSFLP